MLELVKLNGDKAHGYFMDNIIMEMAADYSYEYERDLKLYFKDKKNLLKGDAIRALGYADNNKVLAYLEYEPVSENKVSFLILYASKKLRGSSDLYKFLMESLYYCKKEGYSKFVCTVPPLRSFPVASLLLKVGFKKYQRVEMELCLEKTIHPYQEQDNIITKSFHQNKIEQLTKLMSRSFAGSIDGEIYSEFFTPSGQKMVLNQIVEGKHGKFLNEESLFLLEKNELIGYGLVTSRDLETCFLMDFAIDPQKQGKGLSKKLLHRMIFKLRQKGYKKMRLAVTRDNIKAFNLYKSMGFKGISSFYVFLNLK